MNARLTRHIGSLFAVAILAGCAAPGSSDLSASSQHPGNNFLSSNGARAVAPLAYESKLNSAPAAPAKTEESKSLADAEPITSGPDVGNFEQQGRASWYGRPFHGRKTASGERYDMHALTAAHRTLPLASWVRVTNTANQKTVVVKINDRGPYARGRVIDLSYAAAAALGMRGAGTEKVKIEGLTQQEARVARAQYASDSQMN
ncbi:MULTISPECIES: septal ring lytic transglycosylase RlpA family protein [unclassified Caballeronia]|uniref:septal ring lytic transglycosylase RlpA family protein n=1 Tax=unclassified Caballeronia TaxID=2646786 RepID=UPI0028565DD9|nr:MULTISPECIES: septal ring lytic transglycosylase RlpA family protein [unclassified Caballeronia]MDR5749289.1 septal ring lytic transglycosylase RlpA family protein [Caballeronia sp. LZ024]MDR5843580.1 septal ring lytic transglycosylase RlpA family protein [Caballeronia sp. LZ031]